MTNQIKTLARNLRKNMTDAERMLWRYIRNKQLNGLKFRRQQPIGKYIVDFVCFEKKVIIEVDGGQHAINKTEDTVRDNWLNEQGFKVLRFWNNDILTNCSAIIEEILEVLVVHPALTPPIKGGEQKEILLKK